MDLGFMPLNCKAFSIDADLNTSEHFAVLTPYACLVVLATTTQTVSDFPTVPPLERDAGPVSIEPRGSRRCPSRRHCSKVVQMRSARLKDFLEAKE